MSAPSPSTSDSGSRATPTPDRTRPVMTSASSASHTTRGTKPALRHKSSVNGLTREDAAAQKSENLIQRDFTASAPNQKWLSDITEVPCSDGKLYVSAVLDCFNGEILGLAMGDNMRKELCIQAFENACKARNARGMIFHSD